MKRKVSKKGLIIGSSVTLLLSVILAIGTPIAYNYENLLDVAFSSSSYSVNEEEKKLCEDVVKEGAVLLKNDNNALPLTTNERKVALFGQNSVDFVYGGGGSGSVDTSKAPNMKDAFEKAGFTVNQTLWDFYKTGKGSSYRKVTPDSAGHGIFAVNEVPASIYDEAVKNSLNDDFAICVIGRSGGESADLPLTNLASGYRYLEIDKDEQDMIKLACSKFEKVIVLLNTNNPMELGFLEDATYANVKAAVWIGGVGQEGLLALPKLLSGEYNFSGRLVDTYAYDSQSAPSFQNMGDFSFTNSTVTNGKKYLVYSEGIYVGYRYYETRYEDVVLGNTSGYDYNSQVQFPFGYGLSYSDFSWSDFTVNEASDNKSYNLSVKVTNNSDIAGQDVVEFYLQKPYTGLVETSSIELVQFAKTKTLAAGESEIVTVNVKKNDLTSYDYKTNRTYILDKGDYYFAVGKDAHDALNNVLAKKGKTTSDGMNQNGDVNLANKFLVTTEVDNTSYRVSEYTDKEIANAFDDVDVNQYQSLNYLSRSDWNNTFPAPFNNHSWTAPDNLLADLEFYDVNVDTSDDEIINNFTFKTDSKETSYTVNDLIGVDLNDPRWDDIINQLTWTQQTKLIRLGGYATIQIDRINLPATQDKDGPSGISATLVGGVSCMAWPAEVVMASTWNAPLIERLGQLMGEDSIAAGVAGLYGPACDIHRSPYSGRNFEYYSEDSKLSEIMAGYEMRGLRSRGVIAYIKHLFLNDQETNRYGGAIFANEQAIREIFLKGFEGAVTIGGANATMAAMNRIGARWVGAHKGIMNDVLREEWGFKGMVITDQASVPSMFYQDMLSGLWAGCDLWLNTSSDYWSLESVKTNKTMQYYIHRAAKNIVYAITNSWAVNEEYKHVDDKVIENTSKTFNWRALLWSVDGIVWGSAVALSCLTIVVALADKKKKEK